MVAACSFAAILAVMLCHSGARQQHCQQQENLDYATP